MVQLVLKKYLFIKSILILAGFLLYFTVDLLAHAIQSLNRKIYYSMRMRLVRKPKVLIRIYKVHFEIRKLSYRMSQGIIRCSGEKDKWIHLIYGDSWLNKIKQFILAFFDLSKISTYLAVLLTIYQYRALLSSWVSSTSEWISRENIEFLLLILPVVTIFFGLVYMLRFVSLKGRFKRGVSMLNEQIIIDTLDIHRRLISQLTTIIYEGSQNLNLAINQRYILTEARLEEISPLIERVEEDKVIWRDRRVYRGSHSVNSLGVKEIKEISQLAEIVKEAKKANIFEEISWLHHYQDEMFGLRFIDGDSEKLMNSFEYHLFSPDVVQKMIKNDYDTINYENIQDKRDRYDDQILRDVATFEKNLDYPIIFAIEFIVELSIYHRATYKLLHFDSNKVERTFHSLITKG